MWKKLLFKTLRFVAVWSLNKLWNHIDNDGDGKLSRRELSDFGRDVTNIGRRIKNRSM